MREYQRKKPRILGVPAAVACLVTSSCNLACPHCYARAYEKRDPHDLPLESWKKIIENLSNAGVYGIIITGGEPLLRDDLEKIIMEATDHNLPASLITNGALLTEARLKSIASTGITQMMISLDSSTPEGHDTFRGSKGLFARIQNAVPLLQESGISVMFIAALTRCNIREAGEIIELAHNLGGTRIRLKNLCLAGRAMMHSDLEPQPSQYIHAVRAIFGADQKFKDMYVRFPDLPAIYYEKGIGLENYYTLIREGKIGECGAGFIGAAVGPDGNLQLCDMIDSPMGSLLSEDLETLWNSEEMNTVRAVDLRNLEPCNCCRLKESCLAGCRGLPSQYDECNTLKSDLLCQKCFDSFYEELFSEERDISQEENPKEF